MILKISYIIIILFDIDNLSTILSFTQHINAITMKVDIFQNHINIIDKAIKYTRINFNPKFIISAEYSQYIFDKHLKQVIPFDALKQIYKISLIYISYDHSKLTFSINIKFIRSNIIIWNKYPLLTLKSINFHSNMQ